MRIMQLASMFLAAMLAFASGDTEANDQTGFTPEQTREILTPLLDYALQSPQAAVDCTPICGTPRCCYAYKPKIVTHSADIPYPDFRNLTVARRSEWAELLASEGQVMAANEGTVLGVQFAPVFDFDTTRQMGAEFMAAQSQQGVEAKCEYGCWSCGTETCCGWRW